MRKAAERGRVAHTGAVLGAILVLSGCAGSQMGSVPAGPAAYEIVPADAPGVAVRPYAVESGDVLSLSVFNEPEISSQKLLVDEGGNIAVPLVGRVRAEGRTTDEIGAEIADVLGRRYVRNPRVTVSLQEQHQRIVAVEGEVARPGAFQIGLNTTLLGVLAQAGSPKNTAALDEVVVFRTIEGRRAAARFDLAQIRANLAPDPVMRDGDVVAVGFSSTGRLWENVLRAAPLFNLFVYAAP